MDITDIALKRPLVFGDAAQIEALRRAERQKEYNDALDSVPDCDQCLGDGYECDKCGSTCDVCDGSGKDMAELAKVRERFPDCPFFR